MTNNIKALKNARKLRVTQETPLGKEQEKTSFLPKINNCSPRISKSPRMVESNMSSKKSIKQVKIAAQNKRMYEKMMFDTSSNESSTERRPASIIDININTSLVSNSFVNI